MSGSASSPDREEFDEPENFDLMKLRSRGESLKWKFDDFLKKGGKNNFLQKKAGNFKFVLVGKKKETHSFLLKLGSDVLRRLVR